VRTPVFVECRVDENKSLQTHGYIDCYVSMAVGTRIEKERFARYYVATKHTKQERLKKLEKQERLALKIEGKPADKPKAGEKKEAKKEEKAEESKSKDRVAAFSRNKQARIREFMAQLHTYAQTAKSQNSCIRKLFRSTSYSRRLFSPFHPKSCCPQIKFRNAKGEEKVSFAFLLPVVKDGEDGMVDIVKAWAQASPNLFYRVLADPQLPLPEDCRAELPVVPPEPVQVDPYVVEAYVEGVKVFINQKMKQLAQSEWIEESTDEESGNPISQRLGSHIMDLLQGVSAGMPGFEFLDVSQPLPFLTASPKQPLVPECLGLGLFSRVLHGTQPGLWVTIRGQNQLESHTNAIGNLISSCVGKGVTSALARITPALKNPDQTTAEFMAFEPLLGNQMMVKKYHISRGNRSLFVVILWDEKILGPLEEGSRTDSPLSSKKQSQEELAPRKIAVVSQQQTGTGLYPSLASLEPKRLEKPSSPKEASPSKKEAEKEALKSSGNVPPITMPPAAGSPSNLIIVDEDYRPTTVPSPKALTTSGDAANPTPEREHPK
jgi:hypothetical protein